MLSSFSHGIESPPRVQQLDSPRRTSGFANRLIWTTYVAPNSVSKRGSVPELSSITSSTLLPSPNLSFAASASYSPSSSTSSSSFPTTPPSSASSPPSSIGRSRSSSYHDICEVAMISGLASPPASPLSAARSLSSSTSSISSSSSKSPKSKSQSSPRPASKAAKRAEGYTPRPPNAWILYRSQQIRNLKQDPDLAKKPQSEISKVIGQMWRTESDEVRQWYEHQAEIKKAEHKDMYPGRSHRLYSNFFSIDSDALLRSSDYRFQPVRKGCATPSAPPVRPKVTRVKTEPIPVPAVVQRPIGARRAETTTSSRPIPSLTVHIPHRAVPAPAPASAPIHTAASFSPDFPYYSAPASNLDLDAFVASLNDTYLPESAPQTAQSASLDAWNTFESSSPQWFPSPPLTAPAAMSHFAFNNSCDYSPPSYHQPSNVQYTENYLSSPPSAQYMSAYPSPTYGFDSISSSDSAAGSSFKPQLLQSPIMSHETHHTHSQPAQAINTKEVVGFIGYGNMAAPMVHNLAKFLAEHSCPPLVLWNRTMSKLPAPDASLQHAESLADLVNKCDVIYSSLAEDKAVKAVFAEVFEAARKKEGKSGVIFVETSTIYPTLSGEFLTGEAAINLGKESSAFSILCSLNVQDNWRERLRTSHTPTTFNAPSSVHLLSCVPSSYVVSTLPTIINSIQAKSGQLVWVISGDHFAKKRASATMVPAMGRKVIDVGSNVERAASFKLSGNFLILGIMENLAEALTLADKTGVGADLLMQFVKEFLPAPSFVGYGTKMTTSSFDGDMGFTVEGGLKDANHIRHLAAEVNATVPIIDLAHRNLITSRALGGGAKDWSSLIAGPRVAAGLDAFTGNEPAPPRDTGFGQKTDELTGTIEPMPVGGIKEVRNF
ncbi:hypothetical protein P7C70_g39, partial [Phenoliferia sp. Uapishka_3]